jgi:hypothetical protein
LKISVSPLCRKVGFRAGCVDAVSGVFVGVLADCAIAENETVQARTKLANARSSIDAVFVVFDIIVLQEEIEIKKRGICPAS